MFHAIAQPLRNRYQHLGIAQTVLAKIRALAFPAFLAFVSQHAIADDAPAYQPYFDPTKGFKPAQRSFQAIFLQMAGSLEHYGTPEPYLRHVVQEHKRIDAAYLKATGKASSSRPAAFTDDYLDKLMANWNQMAPVLALESYTRRSGRYMRYAIMGGWNMTPLELAGQETKLTQAEAGTFSKLLEKDFFTKADFQTIDAFYKGPYDRLTDAGKELLSKRTHRGAMSPDKRAADIENDKGGTIILAILRDHQKKALAHLENSKEPQVSSHDLWQSLAERLKLKSTDIVLTGLEPIERDGLFYSHAIKKGIDDRFDQIRKQATIEQMNDMEKTFSLMLDNLLLAAQSEYEAGLYAESLERKH